MSAAAWRPIPTQPTDDILSVPLGDKSVFLARASGRERRVLDRVHSPVNAVVHIPMNALVLMVS